MSNRVKDDGKVSENTSNVNPKLVKGSKVTIGDASITITDPYGIRSFEGREGKHSTGIDLVTSNGRALAVSDGTIVDVKAQHSGGILDVTSINFNDPTQTQLYNNASKTMKPTEGASAGFFVTVKHQDGTFGRYMHLDPIDPNSAKSLIGKPVKRGESLGSYNKTGSGSMTGKHVKFRVFTDLNSSSTSHIDPTNYLVGEVKTSEPTINDTQQKEDLPEIIQGATRPADTYAQFLKDLEIEKTKEEKVEKSNARKNVEQKKEVISQQQQFLQAFSAANAPLQEGQEQQQFGRQPQIQELPVNVQTSLPTMPKLFNFEDGGTIDPPDKKAQKALAHQATMDWLNTNPYMVDGKPIPIDKLQATTPTPGQYPKMTIDRIDIAGVGSYNPGEYTPVEMPEGYKGLPVYAVNDKYVVLDRDFNQEYLNYYTDKKLVGKDVLYPIYGKGTPYKPEP